MEESIYGMGILQFYYLFYFNSCINILFTFCLPLPIVANYFSYQNFIWVVPVNTQFIWLVSVNTRL